jgi:hypothetical protein
MQLTTIGTYPLTVGSLIAVLVLLLALLGLLNVIPLSETVAFGLIGALAVARLT